MMNHQDVIVAKGTEEKTINTVKLTGSVVHKFRPKDNVISLTVAAGRSGTEMVDYPNVVFYGDVAEIIDNTIEVAPGDYPRVCIEGMVQTTRRNVNGQVQYYQNIVGHELRKAPTNMERLAGMKNLGIHKMESCNEACILGKVVNLYRIPSKGKSPLGTIVTLKTVDNGKANFPKVTCFGIIGERAAQLAADDYVCITASVQTKHKKGDNGRTLRYETLIGSEISRIE